jgi:3-oxosteroid 1-dehydrogenase
MSKDNHLSRRKFVKGAAVAGGAIASGSLDQFSSAAQSVPLKWDKEADVVCVGYGGAGAITAITAADLGASVIILEKQPNDTATEVRHTPNTRSAGGAIICATDPAKASDHLFALSWGATPRDICDVWAKYSAENAAWIEKMGGTLSPANVAIRAEFPMFPGSEGIQNRGYVGRGLAFFRMLDDNVTKRKAIQVMYDTPGKELVTDGNGMVIGVVGENAGKPVAVKARKAVVLSCGGYEWDEEMKLNTLRCYPAYFYGNPGNTGDGLRMAAKVGAALWHLNAISGRVIPYFNGVKPALEGGTPNGFLLVDKYGRRFARERPWALHSFYLEVCRFDADRGEYPCIPCYSIFDDVALRLGPPAAGRDKGLLPDGKTVQSYFTWSKDYSEEIRNGWLLRGNTIEELAKAIRADKENNGRMKEEVLAATIEKYNKACENKKDEEFDRSAATLIPIKKGPFYALRMYPGGPNTQGGPKKNAKAQVIDANGRPIPRLYAVGELGSIFGFLYPTTGGNLCEMIAFGRVAGQNAVSEKSWV